MNTRNLIPPSATRLYRLAILGCAAAITAAPAQAAYHLWNIREAYSDASGALQFIEFVDSNPFGGQQFVGGQVINVLNSGGTQSHTFTVPSNLPGDSKNHAFLIGTAGIHAAGGPTPDFMIPNGFLFTSGTFNYFAQGSGAYTLPTDGVNSRTWAGGIAPNSPQNFAGQTGFVVVPEPATFALLGIGAVGFWMLSRRRVTS